MDFTVVPEDGDERVEFLSVLYSDIRRIPDVSLACARMTETEIRHFYDTIRPIGELVDACKEALEKETAPMTLAAESSIAVQPEGIAELRTINCVSRLAYLNQLGAFEDCDVLSIQDIVDAGMFLASHVPDKAQRRFNWPTKAERAVDIALIKERGVSDQLVADSLLPPTSTHEIIVPQIGAWSHLAKTSEFGYDPEKSEISYGDNVFALDEFDGVKDEDFERLAALMQSQMKGVVLPVRLSMNERYIIGFLTTTLVPCTDGRKWSPGASAHHKYNGPVMKLPYELRVEMQASCIKWLADILSTALVKHTVNWYHFVACAYSFAKVKGLINFNPNQLDLHAIAKPAWLGATKAVDDVMKLFGSDHILTAVSKGELTFGKAKIWTQLSSLLKGVQERRGDVHQWAQDLTHNIDPGPQQYGFRTLDLLNDLLYMRDLVPADQRKVVQVVLGTSVKGFDLKGIANVFPGSKVAFYVFNDEAPDKPVDGHTVHALKEGSFPEHMSTALMVDLSWGASHSAHRMDKKLEGMCKAGALIVNMVPSKHVYSTLQKEGKYLLPYNQRLVAERFDNVRWVDPPRLHQPEFFLVAWGQRQIPRAFGFGSVKKGAPPVPDGEFVNAVLKPWFDFCAKRCVVAMAANTWMGFCARMGMRSLLPPQCGPLRFEKPVRAPRSLTIDAIFGRSTTVLGGVSLDLDFHTTTPLLGRSEIPVKPGSIYAIADEDKPSTSGSASGMDLATLKDTPASAKKKRVVSGEDKQD